jgi:hypothetical protein
MPERHRLENAALSRGYERERRNLERGEEALKCVEVRCPMIAMIRLSVVPSSAVFARFLGFLDGSLAPGEFRYTARTGCDAESESV